jgi:CIC family chloride channel protein
MRRGVLSRLFPERSPDLRVLGRTLLHAGLVGLAAGAVGAAFFAALEIVDRLLLEQLAGYHTLRAAGETFLPPVAHGPFRPWLLVLLPALGALAAGAVSILAPETRGGGADAIIETFHQHGGVARRRVAWVKAVASVLTLGTGGAGGREGPTMQIGGALGSLIARWLHVPARERRVLMVAGVAAGIAAVFRTPLGAALLAVEFLYRDDFESDALVPAVLASVVAYSVVISVYGETTMFAHAPRYPFVPAHLWMYAVLAVIVAALSVLFVATLRAVQRLSARLPVPAWARPAVGGLALGALSTPLIIYVGMRVGVPGQGLGLLGGGYGATQLAITGSPWLSGGWQAVQLLVLLCFAKLAASSLTIGTGGSAGDFAPSMVMGGLMGGAFGHAVQLLLHDPRIDPGAFALVGMGTFYGGIAHVPLSAIVLVCELAGSYDLLVPLMLAQGIALLLLRRRSIYTAQLPTRRESPAHAGDSVLSILETLRVSDLADPAPDNVVAASTSLAELVARIPSGTRPTFAVVEDGRFSGLVTSAEILQALEIVGPHMAVIAVDVMNTEPRTVRPDDDLYATLEVFRAEGLDALPVVSPAERRWVGMLRRSAILDAVRRRASEQGAQLLREHSPIVALAQDDQLGALLAELPAHRQGTVQRIPVPDDVVGRSLRDSDFRRRHACEVIAIQTATGELLTPPDPARPLDAQDLLIVLR